MSGINKKTLTVFAFVQALGDPDRFVNHLMSPLWSHEELQYLRSKLGADANAFFLAHLGRRCAFPTVKATLGLIEATKQDKQTKELEID